MDKIKSQIEELKKQLHTMSDYDELFFKREDLLIETHLKIMELLFAFDPNLGTDGIYLYNLPIETFKQERQIFGHVDVVLDKVKGENGLWTTEFGLTLSFGPQSFQQFVNAESFQAHFPKGEELEEMFAVDLERKMIAIQLS
jgi:hypothetical protein